MLLQLCFPFVWLAVTVRLYSHLAWLRLNKSIAQCLQRSARFQHSVLVVGDGFAEGVGDWVVCGARGGLAGRLQRVINKSVS